MPVKWSRSRVPVRAPILVAVSRRDGSLEQLSDKPEQARKPGPRADNAEPHHDPFAHASTAKLVDRPSEALPRAIVRARRSFVHMPNDLRHTVGSAARIKGISMWAQTSVYRRIDLLPEDMSRTSHDGNRLER
jgi:hypothetical protein